MNLSASEGEFEGPWDIGSSDDDVTATWEGERRSSRPDVSLAFHQKSDAEPAYGSDSKFYSYAKPDYEEVVAIRSSWSLRQKLRCLAAVLLPTATAFSVYYLVTLISDISELEGNPDLLDDIAHGAL